MTAEMIQNRLLKVRQKELQRIIDELQAYPPVDAVVLLRLCRAELDSIAEDARRLNLDRSAVSCR